MELNSIILNYIRIRIYLFRGAKIIHQTITSIMLCAVALFYVNNMKVACKEVWMLSDKLRQIFFLLCS